MGDGSGGPGRRLPGGYHGCQCRGTKARRTKISAQPARTQSRGLVALAAGTIRPLIRPPLASPRGIILTHNIHLSLTWRGPFHNAWQADRPLATSFARAVWPQSGRGGRARTLADHSSLSADLPVTVAWYRSLMKLALHARGRGAPSSKAVNRGGGNGEVGEGEIGEREHAAPYHDQQARRTRVGVAREAIPKSSRHTDGRW
jgi:hypothetical protein